MATLVPKRNGRIPGKPWRARVKVRPYEFFLGTFDTKEDAEKAEREFKNRMRKRDGE